MFPAHRAAAAAVLCLAACPLAAQTVYHLAPAAYTVAPEAPIRVGLAAAAGGPAQPWPATAWVFVRGEGTQENLDSPPAADASGQVPLPSVKSGAAMVGVDFSPTTETLAPAAAREFLSARTGSQIAIDESKPKLNVRWTRSCKTFVRIGAAGEPVAASHVAVGKAGQEVEIRPLMDPTAGRIGSDIPMRFFAGGGKAAGARAIATPLATGKPQELRTSAEGIADLRLTDPGVWLIEFHHATKPQDADLAIASATLTFELTAEAARPAPEARAPAAPAKESDQGAPR